MFRLAPLTIVLFVVLGAAACGRTEARTPPPIAMSVPPPPPRVAVPVSVPEPVTAQAPQPPAPPVSAPAPPRADNTAGRGTDRPAAAAPEPAPAAPAPVLQTTTNVGALEERAVWLLAEAEKNLERVIRRDLGAQARAQYDRAISFIRNAKNALHIKNFNYAEQLAAKAAAVARELTKG